MNKLLAIQIDGPGGGAVDQPLKTGGLGTVQTILQQGILFLITATAILSLFFLIYGGFKWMTSQGEKSKIEAAKQAVIYAALGLFIALASFTIIGVVQKFTGANLLQ